MNKRPTHSESRRNSKPPSSGTINTDRCLTHIRDAAHSDNTEISGFDPIPKDILGPNWCFLSLFEGKVFNEIDRGCHRDAGLVINPANSRPKSFGLAWSSTLGVHPNSSARVSISWFLRSGNALVNHNALHHMF